MTELGVNFRSEEPCNRCPASGAATLLSRWLVSYFLGFRLSRSVGCPDRFPDAGSSSGGTSGTGDIEGSSIGDGPGGSASGGTGVGFSGTGSLSGSGGYSLIACSCVRAARP